MLANHHLHVDTEVVGVAEHLDHAANWRSRGSGPTGDFDVDDKALEILVMCCRSGFAPDDSMRRCLFLPGGEKLLTSGNDDMLRHARVERN